MATKLEQAMQAVQSGNLAAGQSLLAQLIRDDPGNETAWLWLANVLDDPLKQRQCLEKVLQLNPENEQAWRDLARLESGGETPRQEAPTTAPAEVQTAEPFDLEAPYLPVDLPVQEAQPVSEEMKEEAPAGMEEFWAGLASVKKETTEQVPFENPVEQGNAGVQAETLPEEEVRSAFPWLSSEDAQGIEAHEAVKDPGPAGFDDFLKSLKEADQDQEAEKPASSVEFEEEVDVEPETEPGWADSSVSGIYNQPVREDEFPMAAAASPVEQAGQSQAQKPKMSRSQTNVIIILAVITFLLLLAALGYIIWDLTL